MLRAAYYSGSRDIETIRKENIALMSDLNFNDSVLTALKLQVEANRRKKNTFFLRYVKMCNMNEMIVKVYVIYDQLLIRFGMNTKINWIQHLHNQKYTGAAHAEELCYIFQ